MFITFYYGFFVVVLFFQKGDQHHDESVGIKNEATVQTISQLLKVP